MPNYNIFIKSECNFHKGDYKRSTRSGKALSVLSYRSDDDADAAQKMTHSILLRDYVFLRLSIKMGLMEDELVLMSYMLIMLMKIKIFKFCKPIQVLSFN